MTSVFPALKGLGFDVVRTPMWNTTLQTSVSGKEVAVGNWSYPRWQWQLTYNFLRSDVVFAEFQALIGFFNARRGMLAPFLYQDADDSAVVGQSLGAGDGATKAFQLVRSFGGFIEPVLAPNAVSAVYVNGVAQAGYTVTAYDSGTPGQVTLTSAPAAGAAVTADFSFYFPCRFAIDTLDFTMFCRALYKTDGVKFISLK